MTELIRIDRLDPESLRHLSSGTMLDMSDLFSGVFTELINEWEATPRRCWLRRRRLMHEAHLVWRLAQVMVKDAY